MNIGFDAKRAFHNGTGLGHYSRTLIRSLAEYFPQYEYFLFNPKPSSLFQFNEKNIYEILPQSIHHKLFPALWRSSWVKSDLKKQHIDLYHGLSHEIPVDIQSTGIKSLITIHDLIFERFPGQYSKIDVKIYRAKIQYACRHANKIIAISKQTKQDLIDFYTIPAEKITVCYQACNPAFGKQVSKEEKLKVKIKYNLPDQFFLYVGSVIERKNLLNICKSMFLLRNESDIPLVVIGDGRKYKQQVKDFIRQNGLGSRILFLSENPLAKVSSSFLRAEDFPAIYQSAVAMIYPSFFEGFGIPVLEALWSRLPVITSNTSCLPEAGGEGAHYVNPSSSEEIAEGMKRIYFDESFADTLRNKGMLHAQNFTLDKTAGAVMEVYKKILADK